VWWPDWTDSIAGVGRRVMVVQCHHHCGMARTGNIGARSDVVDLTSVNLEGRIALWAVAVNVHLVTKGSVPVQGPSERKQVDILFVVG